MMNMTRQEIMVTQYGEFRDLISCFAVHEGSAQIVEKKKVWTFEEAIKLR
jgi:hypothetical protein